MFSEVLSDILRMSLQPLMRFRQHCFISDAIGLNKGENHNWNIYSKVATAGAALTENVAMPETNFTVSQGTLKITEYGKSIAAFFSSAMHKFCSVVVGFSVTICA